MPRSSRLFHAIVLVSCGAIPLAACNDPELVTDRCEDALADGGLPEGCEPDAGHDDGGHGHWPPTK